MTALDRLVELRRSCAGCQPGPAPVVTLTPEQVELVRDKAAGVQAKVRQNGQRAWFPPTGPDNTPEARGLNGFGAELAFATWAGLPWNLVPLDRPVIDGLPDVGSWEVRSSTYAHRDLILHPWDRPTVTVLVTGKLPSYRLVGWHDAGLLELRHRDLWIGDGRVPYPAFFIPQRVLHTLPVHQLDAGPRITDFAGWSEVWA